jgi:phosphoribosylformylglycinamidine cyclo-ligase
MTSKRYKEAGVDIDAMATALDKAKDDIKATRTPGVLSEIGLFGGLFDPSKVGAGGECLVASTDGIGTKVRVAALAGRFDTVGQCLINHCVNDILVQGARPLFFLDYIGTGHLDPNWFAQIVHGLAVACKENSCALLGGETAEMPGIYRDDDFELVGTIVGSVPKDKILDGSKVVAGDVLIGLPSSGLHTNGFSLARKILFEECSFKIQDCPPELEGASLGEALLAVHKSYLQPVLPLLQNESGIHACAHITGGGVLDNLPRVLPKGLGARFKTKALPPVPIFPLLFDKGKMDRQEAWRVFNMGVGFILVVDKNTVPQVMEALKESNENPFIVGSIEEGTGVQLED